LDGGEASDFVWWRRLQKAPASRLVLTPTGLFSFVEKQKRAAHVAALFELIARTKRSVVCSAFADTLMRQSCKSGTNNYAKKMPLSASQ